MYDNKQFLDLETDYFMLLLIFYFLPNLNLNFTSKNHTSLMLELHLQLSATN
jgi:hypothetical protein